MCCGSCTTRCCVSARIASADDDRDRFLLSKGHAPKAFYAVLAAKGFIDLAELPGFGAFRSILGHHPDRNLITGVEIASGSLGHGLPIGVGVALGLRARGEETSRVFVLVGDGELDEGSNHEAIAFAGAVGLDRLTVIAVDNSLDLRLVGRRGDPVQPGRLVGRPGQRPGPPGAGPGAQRCPSRRAAARRGRDRSELTHPRNP